MAKPTTPEVSEEEIADESPPSSESPQVMTEPSSLSAAKAYIDEKIWLTPEVREEEIADESPPRDEDPQVMTEPSSLSAAKA